MATIKIPERHLPALRQIEELEQQAFDSLVSACSATEPTLTPKQFTTKVLHNVPLLREEEILSILTTVLALYSLKDSKHISPLETAEIVSQAAAESLSKGFELPLEKKTLLNERLRSLLAFDKMLAVTAKALDVMTEQERVFCGARILSDIRPVFTVSTASASAAVIVHTLQIGFHHAGDHQEFHVAMDTDDLEELKALITRAEEKTAALKSILKDAKVRYLEV